jgi:hypothetical protein
MIDQMKSFASFGEFILLQLLWFNIFIWDQFFKDISGNSRSVLINSQVLVVAISICVIKNDGLVLFVTGKHFQPNLLSQFVSYEESGEV